MTAIFEQTVDNNFLSILTASTEWEGWGPYTGSGRPGDRASRPNDLTGVTKVIITAEWNGYFFSVFFITVRVNFLHFCLRWCNVCSSSQLFMVISGILLTKTKSARKTLLYSYMYPCQGLQIKSVRNQILDSNCTNGAINPLL